MLAGEVVTKITKWLKWLKGNWLKVLLGVLVLAVLLAVPFLVDEDSWRKVWEDWQNWYAAVMTLTTAIISISILRKHNLLTEAQTEAIKSQNTQSPASTKTMPNHMTLAVVSVTVAGMVIALLAVVAILLISSPEKDTRPAEEQVAQGVEDVLSRALSIEKLVMEEAQQTRHAQMQLAEEVENKLSMTRQQVLAGVHQTGRSQTELIRETRNTLSEATVLMVKQILDEIQQTRHAQEQLAQDVEAARKRAEEAEQTLQKLESALSLLVIGDMAHMKAAIKDCHRQVRREMLAQSSVKPAFNSDDKLWIRASDWIKAAGMLNTDEDYLSLSNPFSFRGSFKDRNGIKRNGHKYYETYRYECPFVPKAGIYGEISIEKQ